MTRNVKIQRVHICLAEGCKFTTGSRDKLQKHYSDVHTYTETVKASLIAKGWDYRFDE